MARTQPRHIAVGLDPAEAAIQQARLSGKKSRNARRRRKKQQAAAAAAQPAAPKQSTIHDGLMSMLAGSTAPTVAAPAPAPRAAPAPRPPPGLGATPSYEDPLALLGLTAPAARRQVPSVPAASAAGAGGSGAGSASAGGDYYVSSTGYKLRL